MSNFNDLCKACMAKIGDEDICPKCGYNQLEKQEAPYLKKGTLLEERYYIGKKLDANAEGIGYIAFDKFSDSSMYIREFFPLNHAFRSGTRIEVEEDFEDTYNKYKESFLRYFRTVANFRNFSAMVPIYDIFTANNTAYVVYEWIDGISLNKFILRSGGLINWDLARPLFMPVVSLLAEMHQSGLGHFGIAPENFIVNNYGKMKLVGFCIPELRKANTNIQFKPYEGCTPIEQYEVGSKLYESSDVYSLTSCIFFSLTGKYPQSALKRRNDDKLLIPTSLLKEIPPYIISAMANALQVFHEDRTASFERLRAEISAAPTVAQHSEEVLKAEEKKGPSSAKIAGISLGIAGFVLIIVVAICIFGNDFSFDPVTASSGTSQSSAQDSSVSSKLQNTIMAPNFVGKSLENVLKESEGKEEYKILKADDEFSDTVPEGKIISQTPKAGENMEKGTAIIVTVSKGSKVKVLPEIKGMTLSEASLKLTSLGLAPAEEKAYSDTLDSGYVIGYKGNKTGDKVDYGTKVIILVSQGPAL